MENFDFNISNIVLQFLKKEVDFDMTLGQLNDYFYHRFRINSFFDCVNEIEGFKNKIGAINKEVSDIARPEYGDFQTNSELAKRAVDILLNKKANPKIIIEPTCGKGGFIIAALQSFSNVEIIYGIEIFKPYVWECKLSVIDYYLTTNNSPNTDIHILHYSVFDFDFNQLSNYNSEEILILGNPPWVTNSKLGSLDSVNLPKKSNFKNNKGIDAITGKGNFDIAEFITLHFVTLFQNHTGRLAFLVKNSVIKNIIFDQRNYKYTIANFESYYIDCKVEFNVSVEASLFTFQFNQKPSFDCKELNLYESSSLISNDNIQDLKKVDKRFGWFNSKFVSDIDLYLNSEGIDGFSPFVWRQGVKHDCSMVMEFTSKDQLFVNGLNQIFALEDDLVYGLIKSSDLKGGLINKVRKYTIITQKKIGQDTAYIKLDFPKTFEYLESNRQLFNKRKSTIYKNKPPFSIFGIGEYSFKPYKVAISGLYKTFQFSLVIANNGKPLMLDDTCYFIGFDRLDFSVFALLLLNSTVSIEFLKSITFLDAKRTFTKDVLMRIDLFKIGKIVKLDWLKDRLAEFNDNNGCTVTLDGWEEFLYLLEPHKIKQLQLF